MERKNLSTGVLLPHVLPYSAFVGQELARLALEISFVRPRVSGILLSGHRGTGKSTLVRAFAQMVNENGQLPVTIPINATEDRVLGGYRLDALMRGDPQYHPGLIEQAENSILYIDEVNLLSDHIVNLILDVTASGFLNVQYMGIENKRTVQFTLIGTMNPEEGGLRPQFLDRFCLAANVETEKDNRSSALKNILLFDKAILDVRSGLDNDQISEWARMDTEKLDTLKRARYNTPIVADSILDFAILIVDRFEVEGNRAEKILIDAASAAAAIDGAEDVTKQHLCRVAPLALVHRQRTSSAATDLRWGSEQESKLRELVGEIQSV